MYLIIANDSIYIAQGRKEDIFYIIYLSLDGAELVLEFLNVFFLREVRTLVLHPVQFQNKLTSLHLHSVQSLSEVQNVGL